MRGEALNVGLLYETEAGLRVRCAAGLDKIRAISAAINVADLRNDILEIPAMLDKFSTSGMLDEKAKSFIANVTPVQIAGHGTFDAPDSNFAEGQVDRLLSLYVDPEPTFSKPVRKRSAKLRSSVKRALRAEKILAGKDEDLNSHRILTDQKLAEGVVIDFLLKNGAIHVCEAVDASEDDRSFLKSLKDIALSALTFEHARMKFEKETVKPRLIYSANPSIEKNIMPSLRAAEHQGAELVNWLSEDDQRSFITEMAKLAEPTIENPKQHTLFHSSKLPYSKLN